VSTVTQKAFGFEFLNVLCLHNTTGVFAAFVRECRLGVFVGTGGRTSPPTRYTPSGSDRNFISSEHDGTPSAVNEGDDLDGGTDADWSLVEMASCAWNATQPKPKTRDSAKYFDKLFMCEYASSNN
jgi:hypothetical protein